MDCKECWDLLSEYSEDKLEGDTKRSLEEHIRACPSCTDAFTGIKIVTQALERLPRMKASPQFDFVLRGKMRNEILRAERGGVSRLMERFYSRKGWLWALAGTSVTVAILSTLLWTGGLDSFRNRWASGNPEAASLDRIEATNYVLEKIALSELNPSFFDSNISKSDTLPERRVISYLTAKYVTF